MPFFNHFILKAIPVLVDAKSIVSMEPLWMNPRANVIARRTRQDLTASVRQDTPAWIARPKSHENCNMSPAISSSDYVNKQIGDK